VKKLPLVLEPEAEADLLDAWEWYENQRAGLGRDFVQCVDLVFQQVTDGPLKFAVSYGAVRQAMVRRFPYVVCYVIEDDRIAVIAVMHSGRDP
jgi:plasmid stabilization system protein ParE